MARLTRKNIKVFAGNATNNGVFGSLQAENPVTTNNVEQIQSLPAWNTGWNSATMTSEKLPPLEEFQGIQYVTTYQQAYIMQEGLPEWANSVTYYKGSLVKEVTANGFRIYNSLTDDNTNNLLSDTSNWVKVMDSTDLYAFDNAVVHLAGAETITGKKTFVGGYGAVVLKEESNATYIDLEFDNASGSRIGTIRAMDEGYLDLSVNFTKVNAKASDSNDSVVTTVNKSKAQNGYIQFGNGLIVQWGHFNKSSGTVSFPKAFTSTNYALAQVQTESGSVHPNVAFNTKTTTGFNILNAGGVNNHDWIAIGY